MEHSFFKHLIELVSIKTRFFNDQEIDKGIAYCKDYFEKYAKGWKIDIDTGGNLLVINPNVNLNKKQIFLVAHIDTVDANSEHWTETNDPFSALVNGDYIIGRGVNDCKAGIAYQLYLAYQYAQGLIKLENISFLISRREEGNALKTSSLYHLEFDKKIQLSKQDNYFISLENTVSIGDADSIEIGIYNKEPSNFFIEIYGTLAELSDQVTRLNEWKPVVIEPILSGSEKLFNRRILHNKGGHIATLENEDNILCKLIHSVSPIPCVIKTGDNQQTSVVKTVVEMYDSNEEVQHSMILNLRADIRKESLIKNLESLNIKYTEYFPFEFGEGCNNTNKIHQSILDESILNEDFVMLSNPGRSDSSAISNSVPQRANIVPFTVGPGLRSHYDRSILRKTHGPNEGFKMSVFSTIDVRMKALFNALLS